MSRHVRILAPVFVFFRCVGERREGRIAVSTCDQPAACDCSSQPLSLSAADLWCYWLLWHAATRCGLKAPISSSFAPTVSISPSLHLLLPHFQIPITHFSLDSPGFLYLPCHVPLFLESCPPPPPPPTTPSCLLAPQSFHAFITQ